MVKARDALQKIIEELELLQNEQGNNTLRDIQRLIPVLAQAWEALENDQPVPDDVLARTLHPSTLHDLGIDPTVGDVAGNGSE